GVTWLNESARVGSGLPAGAASDLVVDPGLRFFSEPTAIYAAIPGKGIYRAILVSNSGPGRNDHVLRLPLQWLPLRITDSDNNPNDGNNDGLDGYVTPYNFGSPAKVVTTISLTTRILLAVDTVQHNLAAMTIQQTNTGNQIVGTFVSYDATFAKDTDGNGVLD